MRGDEGLEVGAGLRLHVLTHEDRTGLPPAALHGFAPAAALAVFDGALPRGAAPQTLGGLPEYVLFSRNHTDPAWATKAPRRLRNVIAAMEWVPDPALLSLREEAGGALSAGQEEALRAAFGLLDLDSSGKLDATEIKVRRADPTRP